MENQPLEAPDSIEESESSDFNGKIQYIEPEESETRLISGKVSVEKLPHITIGIIGTINLLSFKAAELVLNKLAKDTKIYSKGIDIIKYIVYKPRSMFDFDGMKEFLINGQKVLIKNVSTQRAFLDLSTHIVILHDVAETVDYGYGEIPSDKLVMTFSTGNLAKVNNNYIRNEISKFKSSCPESPVTKRIVSRRNKVLLRLFKLTGSFNLPLSMLFMSMKHLDNYSVHHVYETPKVYMKTAEAILYTTSNLAGFTIRGEAFINIKDPATKRPEKIATEFYKFTDKLKEYILPHKNIKTAMDYIIYTGGGLRLSLKEISLALYFSLFIMFRGIGDCASIARDSIYASLKILRKEKIAYNDPVMNSKLMAINSNYLVYNIGNKLMSTPSLKYLNSYFASALYQNVSKEIVLPSVYNILHDTQIRKYLDSKGVEHDWKSELRNVGWYDEE